LPHPSFGCRDLWALVEAHPRDFDEPAWGEDPHPLIADRDSFPDLMAAHHPESPGDDLARIEQIKLSFTVWRPRAGGGVIACCTW
jgi:hypothetical protein